MEPMAVRPQVIRPGDVWLEPIEEILKKGSVDGAYDADSWEETLGYKREDFNYEDVKASIDEFGFLRPLTCAIEMDGEDYSFGDGHHRLAAAIDLGLTHVPIEAYADYAFVLNDSGDWMYGDEIPRENKEIDGYVERYANVYRDWDGDWDQSS